MRARGAFCFRRLCLVRPCATLFHRLGRLKKQAKRAIQIANCHDPTYTVDERERWRRTMEASNVFHDEMR
jgi:hypothetical protein